MFFEQCNFANLLFLKVLHDQAKSLRTAANSKPTIPIPELRDTWPKFLFFFLFTKAKILHWQKSLCKYNEASIRNIAWRVGIYILQGESMRIQVMDTCMCNDNIFGTANIEMCCNRGAELIIAKCCRDEKMEQEQPALAFWLL